MVMVVFVKVWAKISEVTVILHLKVTQSQQWIANRKVDSKNKEKKIRLPNLGLGKLPSSAASLLCDTGQIPDKSATIVTS